MEKYFVSFFFKNRNGQCGIGNAFASPDRPIKGVEETKEIEADLKKLCGYRDIAIINYKKVSDCVE